MTESMIERVRDAIFKEMDVTDGLDLPAAQRYARAAIEAMREPTDFQRDMYYELSHKTETMIDAHWERAIDAALKWPAGSADRAGVPMAED